MKRIPSLARALVLLPTLISTGQGFILFAQQSVPAHQAPIPDARFYELVFRHVLYLENASGVPTDPSVPSPSLADWYGSRVRATGDEQTKMVAAARDWLAMTTPLDQKAHSIIDAVHAASPGGKLAANQTPPLVPVELVSLQQKKDQITLDHIASFHAAIGDDRFAFVNDGLHRAARVTHQGPALTQAKQ